MTDHASVLYAEDLTTGIAHDLGSYTLSAEEVDAFARQWDPQGFHIDEEVAAAGQFNGIIASGLHTMAIAQRLMVTGLMQDVAVIAGRSLDVQMTKPVRPGMTLHGQLEFETVEFRGAHRALVRQCVTLTHEESTVMTYSGAVYVRRRPLDAPGAGQAPSAHR